MCNDVDSEKLSFSRYLSEQVFCFKSDFADPLSVYLKDCSQVAFESGVTYDVYGRPFKEGSDRIQFCHGELNRCMSDPFIQVSGRLPGSQCSVSYHCLSEQCSSGTDGVCLGSELNQNCSIHQDCSSGNYCSNLQVSTTQDTTQGKCVKQRSLGEKIPELGGQKCSNESDYACENNLGCADGVCQKYASLKVSELSSNRLMCQSGFTATIKEGGISACVQAP